MRDGDDEVPEVPPSLPLAVSEETVDFEDEEDLLADEEEVVSLVGQIPWADETPERPLEVVFAGGKGGVGRSLIAANVGLFLSRLGRDVVVADLDPAGQSAHTFLGLDPLLPKPGSLLRAPSPPRLDRLPGMNLQVCRPSRPLSQGVDDPLRHEALAAARASGADVVILDLGCQADPLSLDAFLEADVAIVVTTPDPASVERAYAFLRSALYRRLMHGDDEPAVVSRALLAADQVGQLDTPADLVSALAGVHSNAAEAIRARVLAFAPKILVNRCRNRGDREMVGGLVSALRRRWSISAESFGSVDSDDTAVESLRKRRPLVVEYPGSTLARDIERIARRLMISPLIREEQP
jgi:flagellar biosynthesis protein FlhG